MVFRIAVITVGIMLIFWLAGLDVTDKQSACNDDPSKLVECLKEKQQQK